jgi:3-hydroxyisobutyrate dehydrogenase-like beta-hydroxyacid dehydrogenase
MDIAVIGAGRIGGNIAGQLARAGHALTLAFSRDPAALAARAADLGACRGRATRSPSTR